MKHLTRPCHEPVGLLYHGGAFFYAVAGYVLGWFGVLSTDWRFNVAGTLVLAHAMIIAAYMIHECGHNTVFRTNKPNARLGRFLNWICGTAYGTYEDIRYKHFRHHVDNDDSVWFEYEAFFERHPIVLRVTKCLEWLYIPAHDLIMHFIIVFTSFLIPQRRDQRSRNIAVILIRGGVFLGLIMYFPRAAILYVVARMLMIHILRFMDSLQHDYGANPILFEKNPPSRFGGRESEQQHTFSNPLSMKYDWINWLTLNFGFHNAHHARPTVPWYRLPAFHRQQFGNDPDRVIPFAAQLGIYNRFRVARVTHSGGGLDDEVSPMGEEYLQACRSGKVYGGNAVSFLMSF
jgi:fatty acid desaturase